MMLNAMNDLREKLAALCQDQWSGWMRHMLGKCRSNSDDSVTISAKYVAALRRQVDLSYAELSEQEKDSDRKEADKFLAVIADAGKIRTLVDVAREMQNYIIGLVDYDTNPNLIHLTEQKLEDALRASEDLVGKRDRYE